MLEGLLSKLASLYLERNCSQKRRKRVLCLEYLLVKVIYVILYVQPVGLRLKNCSFIGLSGPFEGSPAKFRV